MVRTLAPLLIAGLVGSATTVLMLKVWPTVVTSVTEGLVAPAAAQGDGPCQIFWGRALDTQQNQTTLNRMVAQGFALKGFATVDGKGLLQNSKLGDQVSMFVLCRN